MKKNLLSNKKTGWNKWWNHSEQNIKLIEEHKIFQTKTIVRFFIIVAINIVPEQATLNLKSKAFCIKVFLVYFPEGKCHSQILQVQNSHIMTGLWFLGLGSEKPKLLKQRKRPSVREKNPQAFSYLSKNFYLSALSLYFHCLSECLFPFLVVFVISLIS